MGETCVLWINQWWACMSKSEWASWVQAVGSVLAILAAVWIANGEVRRQRRAAQNAEKTYRKFALKSAANIHHFCLERANFGPHLSSPAQVRRLKTMTVGLTSQFAGAPVWAMEDTWLAGEIRAIEYQLILLNDMLDHFPPAAILEHIERIETACLGLIQRYLHEVDIPTEVFSSKSAPVPGDAAERAGDTPL